MDKPISTNSIDIKEEEAFRASEEKNKEEKEKFHIVNISNGDQERLKSEVWNFGCFLLDKNCVVYFSQLIVLYTCIAVSLVKICENDNTSKELWISLLSTCFGILLPHPKIDK